MIRLRETENTLNSITKALLAWPPQMADDEAPALSILLTKNGLIVVRPGMELHYERDLKSLSLIETHSDFAPDVTPVEVTAFRKAAWKLASEIARGLGWTARKI